MGQKTPDQSGGEPAMTAPGVLIPPHLLADPPEAALLAEEFKALSELEGIDAYELAREGKVIVNSLGCIDALDLGNLPVTSIQALTRLSSLRILSLRNTLVDTAELLEVLEILAPKLQVLLTHDGELTCHVQEWLEKKKEARLEGPVTLLTKRKTPPQRERQPSETQVLPQSRRRVSLLRKEIFLLVLVSLASMSNLNFSDLLREARRRMEGLMYEMGIMAERRPVLIDEPTLPPPQSLNAPPLAESPRILEEEPEPQLEVPLPQPDARPPATKTVRAQPQPEAKKTIGGNIILHWLGGGSAKITCDSCETKNMWIIRREALGDNLWNCDLFARTSRGVYRTPLTIRWRESEEEGLEGEENLGFLTLELEENFP